MEANGRKKASYSLLFQKNKLMAERRFLLMKLAFKMLHHSDQDLFESQPETRRIRKTFEDNKKRIERTGKY